MGNTNFQTFHQMGSAISDFVKQATGRENVQNIDIEHITVAQNHYYEDVDVSGPSVLFTAGAEGIPFDKCVVQIKPVQDLHGYDNPWPAGGGKNKFTQEGETENSYLLSTGETTSYNGWTTSDYILVLPNTQYTFNPNSSEGNSAKACYYDQNKTFISYINSGPNTFTTPANCEFMRFSYREESTNIQLELGSTATAYEPYSNICPITGWTMVNVYQAGENMGDVRTYRIIFLSESGNVYSGTLDVISGELVVDRFLYVYDGTESFTKSSTALNGFYNNLSSGTLPHDWPKMINYSSESSADGVISSMFIPTRTPNLYRYQYGVLYLDSGHNFNVPPETFGTTVTSFKEKLAELYGAGTPVSVLAKLATPPYLPTHPAGNHHPEGYQPYLGRYGRH